jgi:hypothetical protein
MKLAAAALLAVALAGCSREPDGNIATGDNAGDAIVITGGAGNDSGQAAEVVTLDADVTAVDAAATPMNERVATIGVLNKRNGAEREITLKPGEAARIDDNMTVRLRACERTAPWERDRLTGAFIQVDVRREDRRWHRVFSGWLYKEQPALNVVQHPIYDVWPKSCAMTFRETGPETVPESAPGASSAKKSPSPSDTPGAAPADEPSSAAPSNAT